MILWVKNLSEAQRGKSSAPYGISGNHSAASAGGWAGLEEQTASLPCLAPWWGWLEHGAQPGHHVTFPARWSHGSPTSYTAARSSEKENSKSWEV